MRQHLATKLVTTLAMATTVSGVARAQDFEDVIIREMKTKNIAGVSAAIIKNQKVVWAKGFGVSDVRSGAPVTTDTLFMTASICKTVTATALVHALENGAVGLDEDINQYLGFPVVNPAYSTVPVTFRQVLTHTSSIRDNWDLLDPFYVPGDWPTSLEFWSENYLAPRGRWNITKTYAGHLPTSESWSPWAPGAKWDYSNQGFALAGHLVEATSGAMFENYTLQHLFQPLGMTKTRWHFSEVRAEDVAQPAKWVSFLGEWQPYYELGIHYGYPDFPAGTLRTTPTELAQFLILHMGDGMYQGNQILSTAAAQEMRKIQSPTLEATQGLGFFHKDWGDEDCVGHDGGDPGLATEMWWRLSDGAGVIVFANTTAAINVIVNALFEEAKKH